MKNTEETGFVSAKFVTFLKTTLAKMVSTNTLPSEVISVQFWQTWAKKNYSTRTFDNTMDDIVDCYDSGPEVEKNSNSATQLVDEIENEEHHSPSIFTNPVKYQNHLFIDNVLLFSVEALT